MITLKWFLKYLLKTFFYYYYCLIILNRSVYFKRFCYVSCGEMKTKKNINLSITDCRLPRQPTKINRQYTCTKQRRKYVY